MASTRPNTLTPEQQTAYDALIAHLVALRPFEEALMAAFTPEQVESINDGGWSALGDHSTQELREEAFEQAGGFAARVEEWLEWEDDDA